MRRTIFALALAVGLVGSQSIGIAATTLTGEIFTKAGSFVGTVRCSDASVHYDVSGVATGPVAGTYGESGFIFMADGVVMNWTAQFAIISPAGVIVVEGTKAMSAGGGGPGECVTAATIGSGNASATLDYTATFHDPAGDATESGTSVATLTFSNAVPFCECFTGVFTETFGAAGPVSKDGCKNDGWRNYPQFKNQGECSKFFNHKP